MPTDPAIAWGERAAEVAAWTMATLVNRVDVWGGYWCGPGDEGGPVTRPSPGRRTRDLSCAHLTRHYGALTAGDVVGLHAIGLSGCRWVAVDIDRHGDSGDAGNNERAALAWAGVLMSWGVPVLLTASNGTGGFHLRGIFAKSAPSHDCYDLVRHLVSDYAQFGLTAAPETFPKQRKLAAPGEHGQYGNWLRLPGRHHKRPYWSAVRSQGRWAEGRPAVAHLLGTTGGEFPSGVLSDLRWLAASRATPSRPHVRPAGGYLTPVMARAAAYAARCPNLAEGQGRDDVAYRLAAFLLRDLGLAECLAMPVLEGWDAGNRPPKGRERLGRIMRGVMKYGRGDVGGGLR